MPVTCAGDPGQANPEPDESVILTGTQRYGPVRVDTWHQVHPLIHDSDRGYFVGWDGDLPVPAWHRAPRHCRAPARRPYPQQADRWIRLVMAAAA